MDNKPETQSRIPKYYEPEKYTIELTVDPFTLSYSISLQIDIYVITPSKHLILNALMENHYTIQSLSLMKYDCISDLYVEISNTFQSEVPEHKIEECIYIPISPEVELIKDNKLKLTIQLKGLIQYDKSGLYLSYFSNELRTLVKDKAKFLEQFNASAKEMPSADNHYIKELVLAVVNEPVQCRTIFPCFDEPCYKALFAFSLKLHKEYVSTSPALKCVTNGDLIEVKEVEGSHFLFTYMDSPKMSSYLFTLVIGSFDFIETKYNNDIKIRVFTPVDQQRDGAFAMELAHKALKFYEAYFDMAYTYTKMDLICVPSMEFRAIENWGCIVFLNYAMLFGHFQCLFERHFIMRTILHEISHMWFGNLVTMEWWNDIWLNEGFARIFEFLCCIHVMPEYPFWELFCEYSREDAFVLDEKEDTHPVKCNVPSPRKMQSIFDNITYSKGANIIRMLYEFIGEEPFKQSIRLYLKRYQYKNTITDDLWGCFNEITQQDIGQLMNSWIEIEGHPIVDADLVKENNEWMLKVTQRPFISMKKSLWTIPLFIKTIEKEFPIVLKSESMLIPIEAKLNVLYDSLLSQNEFIVINSDMKGYFRVNYQSTLLYDNIVQIKHKRISSLDIHSLLSYKLAQKDYCGCVNILNHIKPINSKLLLSYALTIYGKIKAEFFPYQAFESLLPSKDPLPPLMSSFMITLIETSVNKKEIIQKLFINESNASVYKNQLNDEYENLALKILCLIGEDKEIINHLIEQFATQGPFTHKNLKFAIYEIIMKYTYAYTNDKEKEKQYFELIYNDYFLTYYSNSYHIKQDLYSSVCKIENSSEEFIIYLFDYVVKNKQYEANNDIYSYLFTFPRNIKRIIDVSMVLLYRDYIQSQTKQTFIEYIKTPVTCCGYKTKSIYYKAVIQFILKQIKDRELLVIIREDLKRKLLEKKSMSFKEEDNNELTIEAILNELATLPNEDLLLIEKKEKDKSEFSHFVNKLLAQNIK